MSRNPTNGTPKRNCVLLENNPYSHEPHQTQTEFWQQRINIGLEIQSFNNIPRQYWFCQEVLFYFCPILWLIQRKAGMKGVKHSVLYMRTRKVFRMPLDKILCLSANAILTIIALWSIASVFFENATIDSIIARFSVASACMANLFSKHRLIRIIFLIMAFVLIIVATTLYVHKANKM